MSILNYEPLLGPQYGPWGSQFYQFRMCTIIECMHSNITNSSIVVPDKILKHFPIYFHVKL